MRDDAALDLIAITRDLQARAARPPA